MRSSRRCREGGVGERPWLWAKMRAAAQTPHSQAGAVVQGTGPTLQLRMEGTSGDTESEGWKAA